MKTLLQTACWILLGFMALAPVACKRDLAAITPGSYIPTPTNTSTPTNTPTITLTPTETNTPTETPTVTPGGPITILVSVNFGSTGGTYNGYFYQATGFTNDPDTGLLSLTALVGDSVELPAVAGFHPLYFDDGTASCIYSDVGTTQTYTFTGAGTYYFHCGFHGATCAPLNSCGSTTCDGMAGVIVVSP